MARSDTLTRLFQHPANAVHRRFEVCRGYFLEGLTAPAIAEKFSLHFGTVQAIVRDFAASPELNQFFITTRRGRKTSPKRQAIGELATTLRRQGETLSEIAAKLAERGHEVSESYLATILRKAVNAAAYPGTAQIPALQAMLALLVPKLLGKRRVSHVTDLCNDEGAGLFAGLNVLPKTTYATDYSYRTERGMNEQFVDSLVEHMSLPEPPLSFNLDFHAIPQIVCDGLGHESPTFLLTNDLPEPLTSQGVIETYASRNHIEHSLGEKIRFFHLDCLSSEVRLNVDFDLTLTVAAAMLYQRLASRLKGFTESTPQKIFRKFVNTPGRIEVTRKEIVVHFEKRAHNPVLKQALFDQPTAPVPWLKRKRVRLAFP